MIRIELLSENNFSENALDSYDRRQNVRRVYRYIDGEYRLVEQPYTEDWTSEKKRQVAASLMEDGCITYLALDDDKVVGFIGLLKDLVGERMILDIMQVSASYRRQGIGRRLFEKGVDEARKCGAKELYISACSSEETIAFYRSMGARLTNDPIKEIADDEPFDLQMTCVV